MFVEDTQGTIFTKCRKNLITKHNIRYVTLYANINKQNVKPVSKPVKFE